MGKEPKSLKPSLFYPPLDIHPLPKRPKRGYVKVTEHHCYVLVEHKRGVARLCINCGRLRYYGAHKGYKMRYPNVHVYEPGAICLPHGVFQHNG